MTTNGLKDIVTTQYIYLEVMPRVCKRGSHGNLSGQMKNDIRLKLLHQGGDALETPCIKIVKIKIALGFQPCKIYLTAIA